MDSLTQMDTYIVFLFHFFFRFSRSLVVSLYFHCTKNAHHQAIDGVVVELLALHLVHLDQLAPLEGTEMVVQHEVDHCMGVLHVVVVHQVLDIQKIQELEVVVHTAHKVRVLGGHCVVLLVVHHDQQLQHVADHGEVPEIQPEEGDRRDRPWNQELHPWDH